MIVVWFILFFSSNSQAQVFIPFSNWRQPTPLVVSPPSPLYLQPGDALTLTASGSVGGYTWAITGPATADSATITTPGTTSDYVARLTAYTQDTITITSGASNLNVAVTTYSPISISPAGPTVPVSSTQDFAVSSGLCVISPPTACTDPTATWSVTSGGASGSVDANGLLTTTAFPGALTLQVQDVIGNTATANVTVTNTLQISPVSLKIPVFSTMQYTAILGTQPYTYTVFSGTGSMGCQSTLTGTHNTVVTTINVTSTAGCPPVGIIKVATEDICYTAITGTTFTGATRGCNSTMAASYTAGQAYNSAQSVYTAPSLIGAATVRVTDSGATTSDSSVTVVRPVDVVTGQYFACVLFDEGSVKCWGLNGNGQLGIGSTATVGDSALEVGGTNQFLDLGAGRTAAKIYAGASHACAILDNNQTKCWGNGGNGRLGLGNTAHRGDNANEMGDNLPAVDLGTGRHALELALGSTHTCARLDNNTVKCWGAGGAGRLGYEGTTNRGDNANEMGDNLPAVDLGTGRTAVKIAAGLDYSCAILDDGTVKCWGENQRGQLGKDGTGDLGDATSEMGDFLTAINIGVGRTAVDIIGLYETVCVERDNATAICWGRNNNGQVGIGSTAGNNANIGDQVGEMAAIAALNFNTGFGTLDRLLRLGRSACAEDTTDVVKCWGYNGFGQLLKGNTTNSTSPPAAVFDIGTGLIISKVSAYFDTVCVLFTNDRIKCFGRARTGTAGIVNGVLINGATENSLGDAGSEVGNSLQYTNY